MEVSPGEIPQEPKIGHGSYSFVVRMGSMAVKVGNSPDRVPDDFIREVGILRMLNHQHLINITRIIVDPRNQQIGLVLPEFQSDLHEQLGELNPDHIQNIMFRTLSALTFLHENEILHRDVSSKNILLNYGGEDIVLTDFGLATLKDYLQTGSLAFGYAFANRPPEVVLQQGISCRSDIWAAGIVFAEMLMGRVIVPPNQLTDDPLDEQGEPMEVASTLERINWVFSQVGTPAARYMDRLDPEYRDLEIYPMGEIFRNLPDSTSKQAIDLLTRMLHFSNASRISAAEALKHDYFRGCKKVPDGIYTDIKVKVHVGPTEDRARVVDWMLNLLYRIPEAGTFIRAETAYLGISIFDRYLSVFSRPASTLETGAACVVIASAITEPQGLNLEIFKLLFDMSRSEIAKLVEKILQDLQFAVIVPTPNTLMIDCYEQLDLTTLSKAQKILRILAILQPCKDAEDQLRTSIDLARETDNRTLEQAVSKWILKDWAISLKMYYKAVTKTEVLPSTPDRGADANIKSPHKTPRHKPRLKVSFEDEVDDSESEPSSEMVNVDSIPKDPVREVRQPSPKPEVIPPTVVRPRSPTRWTPPSSPVRTPKDPVSPVRAPKDPVSPVRAPKDPVSPVRAPKDPGSPVRAPKDPGSPVRAPKDPGSPVRAPKDPGSPVRAPKDPGSPVRAPKDPVSPVRAPKDPVSPVRAPKDPGSPVRAQKPVTVSVSHGDSPQEEVKVEEKPVEKVPEVVEEKPVEKVSEVVEEKPVEKVPEVVEEKPVEKEPETIRTVTMSRSRRSRLRK